MGKIIDLTGQKIGRWLVLGIDEEETERRSTFINGQKRKRIYWKCQCSCEEGTVKAVLGQNLRKGISLSCGCWNRERDRSYERPGNQKDYAGKTINQIYVIEKTDNKKAKAIHWKCKCLVCGSIFEIDGRRLKDSKYQQHSCGCVKSKGELQISLLLNQNNYNYKKQYNFEELPYRYFDFALLDSEQKVYALIEYDGEQHFDKKSRYYSQENLTRDKEKNLFCLQHNLPLYRVPYWDFKKLQSVEVLLNPKYLISKE